MHGCERDARTALMEIGADDLWDVLSENVLEVAPRQGCVANLVNSKAKAAGGEGGIRTLGAIAACAPAATVQSRIHAD